MHFMYKCICIRAVIAEIVPCALGCAVSAFHCVCTPMYDTVMRLRTLMRIEGQ